MKASKFTAYSKDDLILKRILLRRYTKQELLKKTKAALALAGCHRQRGAKAVDSDLMKDIMLLTKDVLQTIQNDDLSKIEKEFAIDKTVLRRLD